MYLYIYICYYILYIYIFHEAFLHHVLHGHLPRPLDPPEMLPHSSPDGLAKSGERHLPRQEPGICLKTSRNHLGIVSFPIKNGDFP